MKIERIGLAGMWFAIQTALMASHRAPNRAQLQRMISAALLLVVMAEPATAQTNFPRVVPGPLSMRQQQNQRFDSRPPTVQDTTHRVIRPSYWAEGALVGGGAAGTLTGLAFMAFCDSGEGTPAPNCMAAGNLGMLGGVMLVGVPAALIGGSIPKTIPPGSVRVGDKGKLGALAFGLPSLVITAIGVHHYCGSHPNFIYSRDPCSPRDMLGAVATGALNTGIGYLLGRAIPKWGPPPK